MYFANRAEAGRLLAERLAHLRGTEVVVFALPRGGVATAAEIARFLDAPLDLVIARKIGHPRSPEYAIAAIAEDGHMIGSEEELAMADPNWLDREKERQRAEARRRREAYLGARAPLPVEGKTAILVDDGVVTGLTLRVGIKELRHRRPKRLIVAVPVIPGSTAELVREEAGELVALEIPEDRRYLGAVGAYYDDFAPVEDAEVVALLARSAPAESNRHGT
ncbi:MAG TPA: phosphoribosyltransferase family protein [Acidobacteriota bacterium]|nr:phosphoribosyltransferase family protein [Acidobacteriota bacterium]